MMKKGDVGDMTLIVMYVLNFLIIGAGVAIAFAIFFGSEYDFRQIDANILFYKIEKCTLEQDINWDLSGGEFQKEFFEKCGLADSMQNKSFVLSISIRGESNSKYESGDKKLCLLWDKNENFPRCKTDNVFKKINGKEMAFEITAGSGQESEEVIT
jgi:hypothetical protein